MRSESLAAAFPELSAEVARCLREMGYLELAQRFQQSSIRGVSFDNSSDAAYIFLCDADAVYGSNMLLAHTKYFLVVDTTVDGEPMGIEWLAPPGNLKHVLRRRARAATCQRKR